MFSFNLWQFNFGEFLRAREERLYRAYKEKSSVVGEFLAGEKDFLIPPSDIFTKDIERLFEIHSIWGGYPEVVKATDEETRRIILKNIYDTYISSDIIELLRITDYSRLKTLAELLAAQTGNLANYTNLAQDIKSYFKEVKQYLTILEETFVISLLRPFYSNRTTELKKNPKVYFVDGGLRNYITQNMKDLQFRADKGQVVENAVRSQLKKVMPEECSIKYWRTMGGAEVDFILELAQELIPIEVKYSSLHSPQISRSFNSFLAEYKPKRGLVLTRGFWGSKIIGETHILFAPVWYL
jgi:predicted AAA+ superfamily ATPase